MWPKVGLARADFPVRRIARVGTRGNAELVPPGICGAFQWYFAWQRVEVKLQKLVGEAFLRRESADLTKI